VFINLQTGRARDLSDGDSSHIEDDSPTSQILSPKDEKPVLVKTKKKPRRITMPPEFPFSQGTRSETRADRDAVNSTVALRSRDSEMNRTEVTEGKSGYSTRSGRTVRPKRFPTETEPEKETKERVENRAKNYCKRRRQHSESSTGEKTDDDIDEENGKDGVENHDVEENISDYKEDGDDRTSNEDGEETDRLSEDSDSYETVEKSTRRRTSDRRTSKGREARTSKAKVDKTRKRRHSSTSSDVRARKSRRTRLKVNYNEDIEDETSSSDNIVDSGDDSNQIIGVSSRGRLRKAASRYADFVES